MVLLLCPVAPDAPESLLCARKGNPWSVKCNITVERPGAWARKDGVPLA